MNNIILYSIHCPRCIVLEEKLKQKNIQYTEESDKEKILEKGIQIVPVLQVDDKFMEFGEAIKWINSQSGGSNEY